MKASLVRLPQLDILRAVAVILVIGYHTKTLPFGWIGVDLFFVLSGFLISGLLFADYESLGRIRIGRFLLRRGLKIYPSFYAFLAVMILAAPHHNYMREFLFVQNYASWSIGHTWSLAIEEHFYLLLPLLLVVLIRTDKLTWIPAVAVMLLTVCLAMRFFYPPVASTTFLTHLRIDALFFGVALRYLIRQDRLARVDDRWLLFGIAAIVPCLLIDRETRFAVTFGLTLNSLGFGALLLWSIRQPWMKLRPLEQVGQASYSIYLWHLMVVALMRDIPFPVVTAMCVSVGIAMSQIIEFPVLALRDYLQPKAVSSDTSKPGCSLRPRPQECQ